MLTSCTAVCSHLTYIVPVSHLKTGIQGPINIIISLHQKKIIYLLRKKTRRPASTDRTARHQFQATGQPDSRAIIIFLGDHDFLLTGSNFGNLTAFRAIFSHIFTVHAQERPFKNFG